MIPAPSVSESVPPSWGKAWRVEREAERPGAPRAEASKADLAELERLRRYLIFNMI
jgi:hypothetical protein